MRCCSRRHGQLLRSTAGERRVLVIICCSDARKEYKDQFAGAVSGQLAPKFGYRSTLLRKEFFVFRKTAARSLPQELRCLWDGFAEIGNVWLDVLRHSGDTTLRHMGSDPLAVVQEDDLTHTSFWELFRYDCSGERLDEDAEAKLRVACAEHRDTGVLTVIPAPRGETAGFDWEENQLKLQKDMQSSLTGS